MKKRFTILLFWSICLPLLAAASKTDTAWAEILRLDSGPPDATSPPQGRTLAASLKERYKAHLKSQEKALLRFLQICEQDPRSFEAKFRLARVLALEAELQNTPELLQQSADLLSLLEKDATPEQKAHIAFSRITQTMRAQRFPSKEQRDELLATARSFHETFPSDPRAAHLLTEVATRFDSELATKKSILEEAALLTKDPQLNLRIKDDLKRIALRGKVLKFTINAVGGGQVQMEALRGEPAVVFYFSEESIPSLVAWEALNEGLRQSPKIRRVAICLDKKIHSLQWLTKEYASNWMLCWDGLGWSSPIAREYGINAVPTAWLLDAQGRLQSLNLLENLPNQLLELEKKP